MYRTIFFWMEYFNILYHLKMNIISILLLINSQVKEVDSFLIVYKYKDRFTRPFKRTLTMLTKMFGNFWTNVVIVVNFWSFKKVNMLNDMYISWVSLSYNIGVTAKNHSWTFLLIRSMMTSEEPLVLHPKSILDN